MTYVEVNQVILERPIELSVKSERRSFVNFKQHVHGKYVCLIYCSSPAVEPVWHVAFSKGLLNE